MWRWVSRSHRADRFDFSTEMDSQYQEEQTDSVSQKVRKVIDDIRSAINNADWWLLWQKLDELSGIFRIQTTEVETIHNKRILGILEWLYNADRTMHWTTPLQEQDYYRNTKGIIVDTKDTPRLVIPTPELVMKEPISQEKTHKEGFFKLDPIIKREVLVLRIYGIEIWKIPRILRGNK